MKSIKSKYNPILTMEYIQNAPEGLYFDRKAAKVKPSDLAEHISGFANAEGGTIVIGISDSEHKLTGINGVGEEAINNLINAPKDCCRPMPRFDIEYLYITNTSGQEDRLLLLHIYPANEQIVRTYNDATYLRIGDRSKELKGEDLRNLEYSKNTRKYEDEYNFDAELEDLDPDLLEKYKKVISAENVTTEKVLKARGFLKYKDGRTVLTNGAVLLFAKNIMEFYPNCRVRFLRYAGTEEGVGMGINIIKDINVDCAIMKLIPKIKEVVSAQLRDFMTLDANSGQFKNQPEYPEFAWQEGIVNAIIHREYGMAGDYIRVKMFDDRLEIHSPGGLPGLVTVENIRETRASRNPRMARVLTEMNWVRELNEGIPRIFYEMDAFMLEAPVYREINRTSVKLLLFNNINVRTLRYKDRAKKVTGDESWDKLDELSKEILKYIVEHNSAKTSELCGIFKKSTYTIQKRLNELLDKNIIERVGRSHDPKVCYRLLKR